MDIYKKDILKVLNLYIPDSNIEKKDKIDFINWLNDTDEYYRISKNPETPYKHITNLIVPISILNNEIYVCLFDHIKSGLYLTSGGHLDKSEYLIDCVRREANEELGVTSSDIELYNDPYFISQLDTKNKSGDHVEFWYIIKINNEFDFSKARDFNHEFKSYKWYSLEDSKKLERLHDHFIRFIDKLIKNGLPN